MAAQTKAGGAKAKQALIKKYRSIEAYMDHMKKIQSRGGKNGTGHAFAHGKVDPSVAGKAGGYVSRRTKKSV
jgi:outer membrane lipoprotein-sorting protein